MRGAWAWILAAALWMSGAAMGAYVPGTTNLVDAEGTTGASYLLYVPTTYSTNTPPPLMVYFDPGANSGYGMERIQPSCEAAGWVLACANGLANSAIADEDIVTREIMDDVRNRVLHDRGRFYLSGLSGGAWRANSIAREYWNEAAGLLLFGCWIGDYDDYTVFPDRLAVARVNGLDDGSAIGREPRDSVYYTQTLVRVHDVHFAGGHEIGPPGALSEAITWLDQDYADEGQLYIPADFEVAALSRVAVAQAAWAATNYNLVVSNAVEVMYRYPMSSSVREAERLLFLVFTNETLRTQISYDPAPSEAWPISWVLMQRGLGTDAYFPAYFAQAYFEAAIQACPTNARALAECARQILLDPSRNRQEWPRAKELAEDAYLLKTNHWRALYVQNELAAQMGDPRSALLYLQAAMDRMPGDLGNDALSNTYEACEETKSVYVKCISYIQAFPDREDFELLPMNRSVDRRRGWAVPWGTASNQTQTVHNGLCSLSITGQQSLVFLNCAERTNETIWIDFYVQPSRVGLDFTNPLPPLATALFYVQSNGLLRVYDGGGSNWVTLAHDPIPTGDWSRISIRADCLNQQWSLFLNDQEEGVDMGFAHANAVFSGFYFLHDGDSPSFMDDLTISTNAPLPDSDRDGLPDAWEDDYALNSADPSDSGLDPDGDLYANYEEYRLGTSPNEWDAPPSRSDSVDILAGETGFSIDGMGWSNSLYRHQHWAGDVFLVSTSSAAIYLQVGSGGSYSFWKSEEASILMPPASGVVESNADNMILVQGPLNAIYHVQFDESTGEFSIEWCGFHDEDGDSMMDEWEVLHSGTTTGLTPYGNPDGDAYPNLVEYFQNTDPQAYDYYSPFASISLTGAFISWYTTYCNMALVGDHVWQYRYWWGNRGASVIKFVANHSWDVNWGDNHQSSTNVSFLDTADLDGANIIMNVTNGWYDGMITFNDITRKYAIISRTQDTDMDGIPDAWEVARYTNIAAYGVSDDPDGDGRVNVAEYLEDSDPFVRNVGLTTNASVNVVGDFSGWNTALNPMQPAGNHLWRLDLVFTNRVGAEFKFVANGNWATSWGASNSSGFELPLQSIGNIQGGSPNFQSAAPLDGVYRFTFNEAAGLCTLDYAPQYLLHQTPEWTDLSTNRALVLKWLSSSDQFYSLYRYTNLLSEPELLGASIRATPPLNVITQAPDPAMRFEMFQIRLEE